MSKSVTYYRFAPPEIGPQIEASIDCTNIAAKAARSIRDDLVAAHGATPDLLTATIFVTVEIIGQFRDGNKNEVSK